MSKEQPEFEVKGLKTWAGVEGPAYQGTLLMDGKPVCYFDYDGWGGSTRIQFHGPDGKLRPGWSEPESGPAADFVAYVKALPPEPVQESVRHLYPEGYKPDMDAVIARVVSDIEVRRKAERSGQIAYRVGDEYWRESGPYTPERRAAILAKNPGAVILNREFCQDPAAAELAAIDKKLQRRCKTQTLFRLPGQAPNEFRYVPQPYTPEVRERILKQYPDAVFINKGFSTGMGGLGLAVNSPGKGRER